MESPNKIFAIDQSLPSFQGETDMFSASLSIASFDKNKWAWLSLDNVHRAFNPL